MRYLAIHDEEFKEWYDKRSSGMSLFTEGTEEKETWLKTDPSVLNSSAREWKQSRPQTETKEPETENPAELDKRFWCDFKSVNSEGADVACGCRFRTAAALAAHRR
eukprot:1964813-Pyramimonas_sp.AAC.1